MASLKCKTCGAPQDGAKTCSFCGSAHEPVTVEVEVLGEPGRFGALGDAIDAAVDGMRDGLRASLRWAPAVLVSLVLLVVVGAGATMVRRGQRVTESMVTVPQSPVKVRIPWDRVGDANWYTDAVPALDCKQYGGEGDWVCGGSAGGTGTKSGTSGQAFTPYYPSGFTEGRASAAAFDGSADYYDFGDAFDQTGDWSSCAVVRTSSTAAGIAEVHSKDAGGGAGTRAYRMLRSSSTLLVLVYDSVPNSSQINLKTGMLPNAWEVCCVSYDYSGTPGSNSTLRGNCNGTAATPVINAVGPIPNVASAFRIGAFSNGTNVWSGDIARVTIWSGRAFTDAELDEVVEHYIGHRTQERYSIAVTRATTRFTMPTGFFPVSSGPSLFKLPAGVLAVEQSGASIEPVRTNMILQSEDFSTTWAVESDAVTADPVVTTNQANGLDGQTNTADQLAVPAVSGAGVYSAVCQTFTGVGVARVPSVHGWTASGTANPYLYLYTGATYASVQCSFTTTPSRCILTGVTPTSATWKFCVGTDLRDGTQSATSANTFLVWGAQIDTGASATSYVATTTGTASRNADVVSVSNPMTDGSRACLAVTGTPAFNNAWHSTAGTLYLWGLGATSAANTAWYQIGITGVLSTVSTDASLATRSYGSLSPGFSAGSTHTLSSCWYQLSSSPGASLALDRSAQAASLSGSGAGVKAQPSTIYVGQLSTGGQTGHNLKNFLACATNDWARCQ